MEKSWQRLPGLKPFLEDTTMPKKIIPVKKPTPKDAEVVLAFVPLCKQAQEDARVAGKSDKAKKELMPTVVPLFDKYVDSGDGTVRLDAGNGECLELIRVEGVKYGSSDMDRIVDLMVVLADLSAKYKGLVRKVDFSIEKSVLDAMPSKDAKRILEFTEETVQHRASVKEV